MVSLISVGDQGNLSASVKFVLESQVFLPCIYGISGYKRSLRDKLVSECHFLLTQQKQVRSYCGFLIVAWGLTVSSFTSV